ncbi:MAG: 5'-methylthioadenosine/adenosylhomocysteine nucleosidase [Lachnospiraceae bacterium]|nr:5'-methylthioadenosine/adenosylhomocysteine nucleosidase [Lachnospiraceae bacterium]
MIGIIGAMEVEVAKLRDAMHVERTENVAGMIFYSGTINDTEVVLVRSGVGKVNAAICTQILCDLFPVSCILNSGIAGSLCADINIGDIVISSDALQHDMDARYFGYDPGVIPQQEVSVFRADAGLADIAERVCKEVNPEIGVFRGRVLSGDQFIADREKKQWLVDTFSGLCTEMEGAAIAHAAYKNGVPFLIVRAISDKADDSATEDYTTFEAKAIDHMVRLTLGLLKEYQK